MNSRNTPESIRNSIPDHHVSFLLLPWSPSVSRRCKKGPQDAKVKAPSLPNDKFETSQITIYTSNNSYTSKCHEKYLQKPTCLRTFQQDKQNSKQPKTSEPSKAPQLAQRSHHHTARSPGVGARDRGRTPSR